MAKVRLFSSLRELCGREFEMEAGNVKELIKKASAAYGAEFERRARAATIMVNGRNIGSLKGYRTPLRSSDEVTIIPAAAGGVALFLSFPRLKQK